MKRSWIDWFGVMLDATSHREKFIAAVGATVGVLAVYEVSALALGTDGLFLVASMGASAILVFAAPHGQFSQPWAVIGGHTIAALIGEGLAHVIADPLVAGPLAVGLTVIAQLYLRCVHPPGGATALTAVLVPSIQALGYRYALFPVLVNALLLVGAGVLYNAFFPWRRYPKLLYKPAVAPAETADSVALADIEYVMRRLDTTVGLSKEELLEIVELARRHAAGRVFTVDDIAVGCAYANDRSEPDWSVRRVEELGSDEDGDWVGYRVVGGAGHGETARRSRAEFAAWARHRVCNLTGQWQEDGRPR